MGKVFHAPSARALGFRSTHAGAMRGGPPRSSGMDAELSPSPAPKVTLPFEFRKNADHGVVHTPPASPPNANSKPPAASSPVNGAIASSPPATCPLGSKA